MTTKKRGRPATGKAVSARDRKRKQIFKENCFKEAAKEAGFQEVSILMSDKQIESFYKLNYLFELHRHRVGHAKPNAKFSDVKFSLDIMELSTSVLYAMSQHLENIKNIHIEDAKFADELIRSCSYKMNTHDEEIKMRRITKRQFELFERWIKENEGE